MRTARFTTYFTAVLAAVALAASASAATPAPTESYAALIGQINASHVALATISSKTRSVKVTLLDGTVARARYPESQHRALVDALIHHGVHPVYASHHKKSSHHVLRYIAAGVVAILIFIGIGVWFYTRGAQVPPPAPREPAATPESATDDGETPPPDAG